jgi:hypothetical protein
MTPPGRDGMNTRRFSLSRGLVAGGLLLWLCGTAPLSGTEPVSMGQLVGYRGIMVPPVEKTDVTKLVDVGTIDTDGFTYMILNLAGEMKENPPRHGAVGALLVPDVPPFDIALTSLNVVAIPAEITAPVAPELLPYVMAKQKRFDVGFPRYRILLYNTTGVSATVAVFAYRSR